LRHNFRTLQKHVGSDITICAVVKCNAYGHGVEECAPVLEQAGAKWFGVTSTDEGIVLRESGITGRILVMCGLYPGEEEEALRHSLTPSVFRLEQAQALAYAVSRMGLDHPAAIHLKIDTGMARLGIPLSEVDSFAEALKGLPQIQLEGVFSHLASSEVLDDPDTAHRSSATRERCKLSLPMDSIRRSGIWRTAEGCWRDRIRGTTSCVPDWRCTDTTTSGTTWMVRA